MGVQECSEGGARMKVWCGGAAREGEENGGQWWNEAVEWRRTMKVWCSAQWMKEMGFDGVVEGSVMELWRGGEMNGEDNAGVVMSPPNKNWGKT